MAGGQITPMGMALNRHMESPGTKERSIRFAVPENDTSHERRPSGANASASAAAQKYVPSDKANVGDVEKAYSYS